MTVSMIDRIITGLSWREPMDARKVGLLVLLTKLKVKMREPLTMNEGDALFDTHSDCIYVVDCDGRLVHVATAGFSTPQL